jgi:hypothetical protein
MYCDEKSNQIISFRFVSFSFLFAFAFCFLFSRSSRALQILSIKEHKYRNPSFRSPSSFLLLLSSFFFLLSSFFFLFLFSFTPNPNEKRKTENEDCFSSSYAMIGERNELAKMIERTKFCQKCEGAMKKFRRKREEGKQEMMKAREKMKDER